MKVRSSKIVDSGIGGSRVQSGKGDGYEECVDVLEAVAHVVSEVSPGAAPASSGTEQFWLWLAVPGVRLRADRVEGPESLLFCFLHFEYVRRPKRQATLARIHRSHILEPAGVVHFSFWRRQRLHDNLMDMEVADVA